MAKKALLNNIPLPLEILNFMRAIDGTKTLEELFIKLYGAVDLVSYIYKLHSLYHAHYIVLRKSNEFPVKVRTHIYMGEVMVFMGYLDHYKLEKAVSLHRISKNNERYSERKKLLKTITNLRCLNQAEAHGDYLLFGEFLLDSEIVTREQLNNAIVFQIQYNDLVDNLK